MFYYRSKIKGKEKKQKVLALIKPPNYAKIELKLKNAQYNAQK